MDIRRSLAGKLVGEGLKRVRHLKRPNFRMRCQKMVRVSLQTLDIARTLLGQIACFGDQRGNCQPANADKEKQKDPKHAPRRCRPPHPLPHQPIR